MEKIMVDNITDNKKILGNGFKPLLGTRNFKSFYISSSLKASLLFLATFAYLLCEILFNSTYIDEIFGCVSLVFLVFFFINNPKDFLRVKTSVYLFLAFFLWTFLSSINNHLTSIVPMILDMVANFKGFSIFFALIFLLKDRKVRKAYVSKMLPLAKLYLITGIVFFIFTRFSNSLGMRGQERFGLTGFNFFYSYAHQFYYSVFFMSAFILLGARKKEIKFYLILSSILLLSTLKGPAMIFVVIFWALYYYLTKFKSLHFWFIVFLFLLIVLIGSYQIKNYLLNQNSPRFLFGKYGLITAITYFPFGSGFGTFGSDMAAKYYSPLYIQYGFNSLWGMNSVDGSFLRDVGWAKYLAQSGFLGCIFFISFYLSLLSLYKNKKNKIMTSFYYSLFLVIAIHAIGSSTMTNSSGIIGLSGLALLTMESNFRKRK